jgi:hypothetical protein
MNDATISLEPIMRDVLQIFDETFETVTGVYLDKGTTLFETLATITAAEASIPVGGKCAALSAQVDHVRFYLDVMEKILQGQDDEQHDWNDIWNRVGVVTEDEWAAIQARLRDSHQRVRRLIAMSEPWLGGGGTASIAIIAHSAYHLGEIRQALCTLRPG